jgi:hypothetical protein
MTNKVVIAGGSGFIGRRLCTELLEQGYSVVVLTRDPYRVAGGMDPRAKLIPWDGQTPQTWFQHVSGARALVNLAGENIAAALRWTARKKEQLLASRLNAARAAAEAIDLAAEKPRVVVQASAIGFYGDRPDEIVDESSAAGKGFLAEVAGKWEAAAAAIQEQGVRTVIIRTGIVLGCSGGFLQRAVLPFRFFLGGHMGSGRQWISWIHLRDEAAAIRFLIERTDLFGPFNLTAPNPLTARDFFSLLGQVLQRPSWLPAPAWAVRLILGEMARELLLQGQRVMPRRLQAAGFEFAYPDCRAALEEALGRPHI